MRLLPLGLGASALLPLAVLCACDKAFPSVLQDGGNAPLITDLGTLVLTSSQGSGAAGGPGNVPPRLGTLATVRGPDKGAGEQGGVTASFTATTNESICVIIDPEDAFQAPSGTNPSPSNSDNGDADLLVGSPTEYTGVVGTSPAGQIGTFTHVYVDPLGVVHLFDSNQCIQLDVSGNPGAHAGEGTEEHCTIPVTTGEQLLLVAQTFSVVPSKGTLTTAFDVRHGACPANGPNSNVNECTLIGDNSPAIAQHCQQSGTPF